MLTIVPGTGTSTRVTIRPAMRAIVSWNAIEPSDTLELIVYREDGRASLALPYVSFDESRRASLSGFDEVAAIDTDVVRAVRPIVAIEVISRHPLERVAVATPVSRGDLVSAIGYTGAMELPVPEYGQYDPAHPAESGWCAPASIAMLLGAWVAPRDVAGIAAAVHDDAYRGAGNWTFDVALPGSLGYVGAVAYLRGCGTLEGFIAAGLPLAVSLAWDPDELPGAPLPRSTGHVLVVRGFDRLGDVIVNDPALPDIRHVYPRAAFERCWLGHGGVGLLVAPATRLADVLRCANA